MAATQQDIWTISRMMDWMRSYLADHGDDNPRLSAQWLISDAASLSRMELFMQMDKPLSPEELATLRASVKRRVAGEPLQYITGEAPFRYLNVKVRPGVLIPRPETEVLVSELLSELPRRVRIRAADYVEQEAASVADPEDRDEVRDGNALLEGGAPDEGERPPLTVVDLCTGSGCIACSLASEHPDISVIATDISDDAISLAQENVEALGLSDRIQVLKGDLGSSIDDDLLGTFDAVISNPPYIPTDVLEALPHEVSSFEPALALDGGADGLDVFRRIVAWSKAALRPDGVLACELHEDALGEAASIAADNGFVDIRIAHDLADRPRVLIARTIPAR